MSSAASIDRLSYETENGSCEAIIYENGASIDDVDEFAALLEEFALDEPCLGPLQLEPLRLRAVARRWALSLLANADLCVVARVRSCDSGNEEREASSSLSPDLIAAPPPHRRRVVGVALNFHVEPGQTQDDDEGWLGDFYNHRELREYESFLIALERRADVCTRYGDGSGAATPALLIGVLACARDQRGRGIAGGLLSRSLELAERRGYRLATATATSVYSQRAFERAGFERVLEVSYAELPNASLYSDEHRRLHRGVFVYARRLLVDRRVELGADVMDRLAIHAQWAADADSSTRKRDAREVSSVGGGCE